MLARLEIAKYSAPTAATTRPCKVDFGEALWKIAGSQRKIDFFVMDLLESDTC